MNTNGNACAFCGSTQAKTIGAVNSLERWCVNETQCYRRQRESAYAQALIDRHEQEQQEREGRT